MVTEKVFIARHLHKERVAAATDPQSGGCLWFEEVQAASGM